VGSGIGDDGAILHRVGGVSRCALLAGLFLKSEDALFD
jgi:hypothetical protein